MAPTIDGGLIEGRRRVWTQEGPFLTSGAKDGRRQDRRRQEEDKKMCRRYCCCCCRWWYSKNESISLSFSLYSFRWLDKVGWRTEVAFVEASSDYEFLRRPKLRQATSSHGKRSTLRNSLARKTGQHKIHFYSIFSFPLRWRGEWISTWEVCWAPCSVRD